MNKSKPTCFQKKYGSTTNLLSLDMEKRLGSSEWWSHLRWLFWQSPWCPCRWSLVHLRFQEIVDKIHLTTWDRKNMENNWNVYGMFTSIIVRLGQMKPNGMSCWKSRWTKKRDVVELFLVDSVCLRFLGMQFNNLCEILLWDLRRQADMSTIFNDLHRLWLDFGVIASRVGGCRINYFKIF